MNYRKVLIACKVGALGIDDVKTRMMTRMATADHQYDQSDNKMCA